MLAIGAHSASYLTFMMVVIETERLLLRRLTVDDADDLVALYADPEVMRFFDEVRTRDFVDNEIADCLAHYHSPGYYFWATIHRSDNCFIGRCGLLPQIVEGNAECEVAYMIARRYWGRGLGTEAARAITRYGFTNHGFPRLISLIAPGNCASQRVAANNGMRYVKDVEINGYVDQLHAIDRAEWRASVVSPG